MRKDSSQRGNCPRMIGMAPIWGRGAAALALKNEALVGVGFLVTIWIGFIEDGLTRTGNSTIFPAAKVWTDTCEKIWN